MVAVAEELEPSFGPAILSFKLKPGNAPVMNEKSLILGDIVLVGYLKFRPGKHIDGADIEVEVEVFLRLNSRFLAASALIRSRTTGSD